MDQKVAIEVDAGVARIFASSRGVGHFAAEQQLGHMIRRELDRAERGGRLCYGVLHMDRAYPSRFYAGDPHTVEFWEDGCWKRYSIAEYQKRVLA